MELFALAPAGMVGWQEEFDDTPALLLNAAGELKVRLFVTPRGITVMVAADNLEEAGELLRRAGFPVDRVRRLLCG